MIIEHPNSSNLRMHNNLKWLKDVHVTKEAGLYQIASKIQIDTSKVLSSLAWNYMCHNLFYKVEDSLTFNVELETFHKCGKFKFI